MFLFKKKEDGTEKKQRKDKKKAESEKKHTKTKKEKNCAEGSRGGKPDVQKEEEKTLGAAARQRIEQQALTQVLASRQAERELLAELEEEERQKFDQSEKKKHKVKHSKTKKEKNYAEGSIGGEPDVQKEEEKTIIANESECADAYRYEICWKCRKYCTMEIYVEAGRPYCSHRCWLG